MSSNQDNQPKDKIFDDQIDFMKTAVENSLQEGDKCMREKDYESAIQQFSAAVQVLEMLYGNESIEMAFPTYKYGIALYRSAVANHSALGLDNINENDDNEMEEQAKTNLSGSKAGNIQIDAAEDLDEVEDAEEDADEVEGEEDGDDEGENGEEEGDADDFSLAFTTLAVSLNLYKSELTKDPNNATLRDQMCEVYLALGDVSLESENFEQAIEEYKNAESNIRQYLSDQTRRLGEVLYLLAVAHEYNEDYTKSREVLEEVKTLLNKRKSELDLEKAADQEEAKDLDELINEVANKIKDTITTENLASVIAEALQKQQEQGKINIDPELLAKAKDVSGLVKRKRNGEESSSNKEVKTE